MRNLFILTLIVFAACKANQNTSGNNQDDPIKDLNQQWVLVSVKGQSVEQLSYSSPPTLEFNTAEDRINGYDGCNNFFGQLEVPDSRHIKLRIMGSTKAYCPEIKNSDMLGQYLHAVTNFKIKQDMLYLIDEEGNEVLRYQKAK